MSRRKTFIAAAVIGFLLLFLGALREQGTFGREKTRSTAAQGASAPSLFGDLNARHASPREEVQIVLDAIETYEQLHRLDALPIGLNEDLVVALSTASSYAPALLSPDDPAVVDGRLVDRWGTPLHLHALAARHHTVRSAGPDRILFTEDDLVVGEPTPVR